MDGGRLTVGAVAAPFVITSPERQRVAQSEIAL